jgi:hypothetical protein
LILYVNGDSHSYGQDAGGPLHTYGKKIADYLNFKFVCDAENGASTQRIIRTSKLYLEHNTPNLIIIGWSTWEREEFLIDGEYYQFSYGKLVPNKVKEFYKQWVIDRKPQYIYAEQAQKDIWQFHQELTAKNLPHLFFNCYSDLNTQPILDWSGCYIDPYKFDMTYWKWLNDRGYKSNKWFHFGEDAHQAWANHLTNILKESIITK